MEGTAKTRGLTGPIRNAAQEGRKRPSSLLGTLTLQKPVDPFNFAGMAFNFAMREGGSAALDWNRDEGHVFGRVTATKGTKGVTSILDRATAIIRTARSHPDPEGAMERLEAEAPEDEKVLFPMLWEGLVLVLNDAPN